MELMNAEVNKHKLDFAWLDLPFMSTSALFLKQIEHVASRVFETLESNDGSPNCTLPLPLSKIPA
jgi:hypothetical protein